MAARFDPTLDALHLPEHLGNDGKHEDRDDNARRNRESHFELSH